MSFIHVMTLYSLKNLLSTKDQEAMKRLRIRMQFTFTSFICNEAMNINGIIKFYNVVGMPIIVSNLGEWDIKTSSFVLIYAVVT